MSLFIFKSLTGIISCLLLSLTGLVLQNYADYRKLVLLIIRGSV